MSDQVIVVPEGESDAGDTATAFAAGVAAAESAQASEDAAEALEVAEAAAEVAEHAAEAAVDAVMTAERNGVSPEELHALRAEVGDQLEEIRGMIADLAIGEVESPLTPERVERESAPGPEEGEHGQEEKQESKSAGKYGSARWFSR